MFAHATPILPCASMATIAPKTKKNLEYVAVIFHTWELWIDSQNFLNCLQSSFRRFCSKFYQRDRVKTWKESHHHITISSCSGTSEWSCVCSSSRNWAVSNTTRNLKLMINWDHTNCPIKNLESCSVRWCSGAELLVKIQNHHSNCIVVCSEKIN